MSVIYYIRNMIVMLLIALFGILLIANLAGMLVTEPHIIILDKYVIDTNKKTDGTLLLELPDGLREVTYKEETPHFYLFKDSTNYYKVPNLKTKSRAVAKTAPKWRAYKYFIKYTTKDKTPIIIGKILAKEGDTDYNSALELVAKNEKEVHNKVVNHFVWFILNLVLWYTLSNIENKKKEVKCMSKLMKLFFVSLVLVFITQNNLWYLYASETKTITVTEKTDKDGNVILVDEEGNIYTKENKKELTEKKDKDGKTIIVDEENNIYTKDENAESKLDFYKTIITVLFIFALFVLAAVMLFMV